MLSKPPLASSEGSSVVASTVEVQEIADRVGVFGAVQPVDERPPGIGRHGGRAIEPRFEPHGQRLRRRPAGPASRAAASCPS